MPLPVRFHPGALLELRDGAAFYGERFVSQIDDAITMIAELPHTWPVLSRWPHLHRRALTKVPYAIVYSIDPGSIFIVALEHTKRRPGYWLTRV